MADAALWSTASCGPLAQLVEQETLNLLVVGSIPTRPTIQGRSGGGIFGGILCQQNRDVAGFCRW